MRKRTPTYKQMAFETAVRNPERYILILKTLEKFENYILSDENLLTIVSTLYLKKIVTSKQILITDKTTIEDIKDLVKIVNNTRRADGGFPSGYPSRFWTYMRTPSELGLVYAQYNKPFKLSIISKKLIHGEIDEQEAFSIQLIRYNRKNPYRNVKNDFNYFRFILELLLKIKSLNKNLNYEQFIITLFEKDGNVRNFLNILKNYKFRNYIDVYNYLCDTYNITTRFKTVTQDYPDVVRRLLIISGFISIRFQDVKSIQINENKLDYIKELLKFNISLSEEEKTEPLKYFQKLNEDNNFLLNLVKKYRNLDKIDGKVYLNKIFQIIKTYQLNEEIIVKSIRRIGTRNTVIEEFKEIPEPLKLEFFISLLIAIKYGKKFYIKPNYKTDHFGKPYSHAPGNKGDIEVYSKKIYWLIEVTLIRNKTQQLNNETTSVIRHLIEGLETYKNNYLSFVAPIIHTDVEDYFKFSIVQNQLNTLTLNIKPYSLSEFIKTTISKTNFSDMEKYTTDVIKEFKQKLR